MQPISHLARFGSSRAARLVAAVALVGVILPALPGAALAAAPDAAMIETSITIWNTASDTDEEFGGYLVLAAGTYSWTEGFFYHGTVGKYYPKAEAIVADLIQLSGGEYLWKCWLSGDSATNSYTSGCVMWGADYHSLAINGFSSVNYNLNHTFNWQVSWVPSTRTLGGSRTYNGFTTKLNALGNLECTWGAANKSLGHFGLVPNVSGDARTWSGGATSIGWTVKSVPESDSIVVWQPGVDLTPLNCYNANGVKVLCPGHVGWVEGVEYRAGVPYIHTAEANVAAGLGRGYMTRTLKADLKTGRSYILVTN